MQMADNRRWRTQLYCHWDHRYQKHALKNKFWKKKVIRKTYTQCFIWVVQPNTSSEKENMLLNFLCYV